MSRIPVSKPNSIKKKGPLPTIVKPVVDQSRSRRLIDSSVSSRPTSARIIEESDIPVAKLNIQTKEELDEIQTDLNEEPASTRSKSLLKYLAGINGNDQEFHLELLLKEMDNWDNESVFNIDFRVYHVLSQALFEIIVKNCDNISSPLLLKAVIICMKMIPLSDRDPLEVIIRIIYDMSKNEEKDTELLKYGIIPPLMKVVSRQYDQISLYSAASLRHISINTQCATEMVNNGIIKIICEALQTRTRRERFQHSHIIFIYQIVGLLTNIWSYVNDYSFLIIHPLPVYLLQISTIYEKDSQLLLSICKALNTLVLNEPCIECIETEDLVPFYSLLLSSNQKIAESSSFAYANIIQQSEIATSSVVYMNPPFGIYGLFTVLTESDNQSKQMSMLRCIARCSAFQKGSEIAFLYISTLFKFLDIPLDDIDVWNNEQIIVANTLIILKNLCVNHVEAVSLGMKDKMNKLMFYGIIDYVISLMRSMMKCSIGWEVCLEVKDVEEIRLMLPVLCD